jgi:mannosyl-3-phosphoglycerate phosphatase
MKPEVDLIVFTDLDGTLIDHDTYEWDSAREALTALDRISAGIVLASSKTSAEIGCLRTALGLQNWPAIVENGAGLLPENTSDVQGGSRYHELLSVLADVPEELRCHFHSFGAATTAQVAKMTGLVPEAAALAKRRAFSEPGQWSGTDLQKADFVTMLKSYGVQAQQGGRFLTLSFGGNKVDQMRSIIKTYRPKHSIALGDAPNDVEMLEAAEFGVVVANPHHPPLPPLQGEAKGKILRTNKAGPSGWNEAILYLLHRLELH